MSQELPKEPKFYPNEDSVTLSIANVNVGKLRVPSGQKVTYEANDEGIVKVTETFDQDGESLHGSNQIIIPKEVFVEAYKKYIKNLEDKVKRLEKSNRNWRRKCQRLRNESKWFSEMIKPEEHKRVIVRDENGKEYRNHEWTGHAWYSFSGCDGWRTDVDVISWRYQ